jgi:site-specific DNA-methyltransferase (adenine-specific)
LREISLLLGDCLEVLRGLPDCSVDACVTDPPYGLSFMGKAWDHSVPSVEVWREVLRVLKPGAHLLAFFGTRTYHRGVVAIEDAGFEVRDQIGWAFGSGFPKSLNLKGDWQGWGTALKPAWEPIVVARKPFVGTVAGNVLEWGTGAINVDGCRVGTDENLNGGAYSNGSKDLSAATSYATGVNAGEFVQPTGRWPANLIHDGSDEVAGLFPVTGPARQNKSSDNRAVPFMQAGGEKTGGTSGRRDPTDSHDDQGGSAARFFYCAKAGKADREDGLGDRDAVRVADRVADDGPGGENPRNRTNKPRVNHHPTVKPTDLMRYLCRLVTPPGGVVLDPFMGSGSTGRGAVLEGFGFTGIEIDPEYLSIARDRIEAARPKEEQLTLFPDA